MGSKAIILCPLQYPSGYCHAAFGILGDTAFIQCKGNYHAAVFLRKGEHSLHAALLSVYGVYYCLAVVYPKSPLKGGRICGIQL